MVIIMGNNVAINKETACARIGEIFSETEGFLAEMEDGYAAFAGSITYSKGDYIEALKIQIASEQEMIWSVCSFFQTLLQMMQAAESDFDRLDQEYAKEKIR